MAGPDCQTLKFQGALHGSPVAGRRVALPWAAPASEVSAGTSGTGWDGSPGAARAPWLAKRVKRAPGRFDHSA